MNTTATRPVASEPVSTRFSSQAEAVREARIAIWGDVSFAKREHVRTHSDVAVSVPCGHLNLSVIAVSANVNGRLVLIKFDAYGRLDGKVEVIA